MAAGLTMGYMSFDKTSLENIMKIRISDCITEQQKEEVAREKKWAAKVYPLVAKHHLLLVTLLLFNAVANEALPIFLDRLTSPLVAVLLSVSIVLIFCEILPSAIFTGENKLKLAANLSCLVWCVIYLAAPIAWPLAKILDRLIDDHDAGGRYRKPELKSILRQQMQSSGEKVLQVVTDGDGDATPSQQLPPGHARTPRNARAKKVVMSDETAQRTKQLLGIGLHVDEVTICLGALELKHLKVRDIMLTMNRVYMLDAKTDVMDEKTMADIIASGYSRVIVYSGDKHNVRGLLLVKKLILLDPDDCRQIDSLGLRRPMVLPPDADLLQVLNSFQTGKSHLAIITDNPSAVERAWSNKRVIPAHVHMAGIITIEDVIEKLIKEPISDETEIGVVPLLRRARRIRKFVKLAHTYHGVCEAEDKLMHLADDDGGDGDGASEDLQDPAGAIGAGSINAGTPLIVPSVLPRSSTS